jgi:hypothetical protein
MEVIHAPTVPVFPTPTTQDLLPLRSQQALVMFTLSLISLLESSADSSPAPPRVSLALAGTVNSRYRAENP